LLQLVFIFAALAKTSRRLEMYNR